MVIGNGRGGQISLIYRLTKFPIIPLPYPYNSVHPILVKDLATYIVASFFNTRVGVEKVGLPSPVSFDVFIKSLAIACHGRRPLILPTPKWIFLTAALFIKWTELPCKKIPYLSFLRERLLGLLSTVPHDGVRYHATQSKFSEPAFIQLIRQVSNRHLFIQVRESRKLLGLDTLAPLKLREAVKDIIAYFDQAAVYSSCGKATPSPFLEIKQVEKLTAIMNEGSITKSMNQPTVNMFVKLRRIALVIRPLHLRSRACALGCVGYRIFCDCRQPEVYDAIIIGLVFGCSTALALSNEGTRF